MYQTCYNFLRNDLRDLDKFEGLVVPTMMRPHDNCGADLHHPSLNVEDEAVQFRPDCAPVKAELLVGSTVGVAPALQTDSTVPVTSRDVDDRACF